VRIHGRASIPAVATHHRGRVFHTGCHANAAMLNAASSSSATATAILPARSLSCSVLPIAEAHFEGKVWDIVGLYLAPLEGEVVVLVDAKSGIQALDRTQPLLPIDFGKTQKRTFDYARMGPRIYMPPWISGRVE
jgi:hypothetical protein